MFSQWIHYKNIPINFYENTNVIKFDIEVNSLKDICVYSNLGNLINDPKGNRICVVNKIIENQVELESILKLTENGNSIFHLKTFSSNFFFIVRNRGWNVLYRLEKDNSLHKICYFSGNTIDYSFTNESIFLIYKTEERIPKTLLFELKNDNIIRKDTLQKFSPNKICSLNDSINILISDSKIVKISKTNTSIIDENINNLKDVSFKSEKIGYYLNSNGELYRTMDFGKSWVKLLTNSSFCEKIFFKSDSSGYFIDDKNNIYFTENYGNSWKIETIESTENVVIDKIIFLDESTTYLLSKNSLFTKSCQNPKTNMNNDIQTNYNNLSLTQSLLLYPNPTNKLLNIQIPEDFSNLDIITISLFNNIGEIQKEYFFSYQNFVSIDVSNFPNGIYYIEIKKLDKKYTSKFVISK